MYVIQAWKYFPSNALKQYYSPGTHSFSYILNHAHLQTKCLFQILRQRILPSFALHLHSNTS